MSSQEFFDIYTEDNNPTGKVVSRAEAHHTLTYWHRTTHIWIVNDNGDILCQQRSFSKDSNPGKWQSFFGGHLKAGETYSKNALGELAEELGLSELTEQDLQELYIKKSDTAKHHGMVYLLRWSGDIRDLSFADGEVEQVCWISQDEIVEKCKKDEFCNSLDSVVFERLRVFG